MKKLPILIFIVLCFTAMATSYGSYRKAQRNIESDLQQALAKTINEKGVETMRQDSIRAYRSIARTEGEMMTIAVGDETLRRHLRNQQLGEMAFITYTVGRERGRWKVTFDTEAKCSAAMIWSLSDQRLSAWLTVMALLSLALSFRDKRQSQPTTNREPSSSLEWPRCEGGRQSQPTTNREPSSSLEWPRCEGGRQSQPITMDCFSATHLTPMQRQLMEMFVASDSHRLSKHEICDVLWPKKDDANETLYALISRLKRELDKTSNYDIISDRGRAYVLKQRKSGS
ncbi:helix-turn-helix domain-containing protein [Prevotella sp. P5-92]|uniref:helix-turn-helix domain-containing protein n=1 Tax=Prevotella sp. P5-92 TaxID=2024222 RepID=UPI0020B112E0|nr:helix-turn-helix domain-containing protein [Prevotella sp. P5-92]